jgi:hypothetical protein
VTFLWDLFARIPILCAGFPYWLVFDGCYAARIDQNHRNLGLEFGSTPMITVRRAEQDAELLFVVAGLK